MNDLLLCGTQLRFADAPEGHGAPRETFQSVDSLIQIILSKNTRTLEAVLDISHENSEAKPTPGGRGRKHLLREMVKQSISQLS